MGDKEANLPDQVHLGPGKPLSELLEFYSQEKGRRRAAVDAWRAELQQERLAAEGELTNRNTEHNANVDETSQVQPEPEVSP